MKREPDLIRKILFAMEAKGSAIIPNSLEIEGYTKSQVNYHLELLCDAGQVVAVGYPVNHYRLTNQGHDFLDAIRDDTRWNKVVNASQEAGGFVLKTAVTVAVALLQAEIKRLAGIP